jgi:hypothetical protein
MDHPDLMRYFSSVEDVFTIAGRGCVVVPVIPSDVSFEIHNGDSIQLRNSSGVVNANIASVELLKPVAGPCRMAFLLSGDISKSDVPSETEIWVKYSK